MKYLIIILLFAVSAVVSAEELQQTSIIQNTQVAETYPVLDVSEGIVTEQLRHPDIEFYNYTQDQIEVLQLAHKIGEQVGGHGEAIQAIVLQESSAGGGGREGGFHLPFLKRYFGVMQMKVVAVMDVLNTYSELATRYFPKYDDVKKIPAKKIIQKLKADDEFSLVMGAHYYHKYFEGSVLRGVVSYNAGPGGVLKVRKPENHWYAKGISKKLIIAREFNKVVVSKTLVAYNVN